MTTVHGIQLSPFVRKVIFALETKGIEFTINPITPMSLPEDFEKLSPLLKIPAFEDDLITTADSSVICEYLDQRYSENPIYPQDLIARTRVRWFEEYADTALLNICGPIFFERIVKTKIMKQEGDEQRVQDIIENGAPSVFDYLNEQLNDAGFIVGNTLTTADFAIGSNLINALYAGFDVDAKQWPKLSAYTQRLYSTPLFQNRLASDKAIMSK